MKRHGQSTYLRLLAALVAALICLVLFPLEKPVLAASSQKSLKEIQSELASVRSDRDQLSGQKDKLTGELAYLQKRSEAQLEVYENALAQKEAALMILEMNQEAAVLAQADYESKVEQYEERVVRMYEWNRYSMFELLLSSESLQGFFTTIRFMKMVADSDEEALAELEAASILAEQLKAEAEDQYSEMIGLVEEADQAMKAIKAEESLAADQLKKVAASLEITRQKEAQLVRDEKAAQTPPPTTSGSGSSYWVGTGKFIWPLPTAHYVTSVFGWRAKYGRYHYGTDVAASMNTPIVAMADGVVTYVGWPGSAYHWAYGKMVVIDHGGGYQTRYGHLNGFNSHIGQRVKAGQVIGYTGNTGRSSGPHLHFEIRVNGVPKDPLGWFRRAR